MKKYFTLIITIALSLQVLSRDARFSISFPANWKPFNPLEKFKGKIEHNEIPDSLKKWIKETSATIDLYNYEAPLKQGILFQPCINVTIDSSHFKNEKQFRRFLEYGLKEIAKMYSDFKIIDSIQVVNFKFNYAGFYMKYSGNRLLNKGVPTRVNTRMYVIPDRNIYYQIIMNDTNDYNCQNEFDDAFLSIRLE